MSEKMTHDESKNKISEHLDAAGTSTNFHAIVINERRNKGSHLLDVSQLDEQTHSNSWRKVHWGKNNLQILTSKTQS